MAIADEVESMLCQLSECLVAEQFIRPAVIDHHPAATDEVPLAGIEDAAVVLEVLEEAASRIDDIRGVEGQY